MTLVEGVNRVLTILTVLGQIQIGLLLLFGKKLSPWVRKNVLTFAFVVSMVATLGSFFYSEIAQYTPCKLCWFQRIFMYPLPFILGVAIWKKDLGVLKYVLTLSGIGEIIAVYHYLTQIGVIPNSVCGVVGYSVACSQRFVMEAGYITIPMMSATAFGLLFLFAWFGISVEKKVDSRQNSKRTNKK